MVFAFQRVALLSVFFNETAHREYIWVMNPPVTALAVYWGAISGSLVSGKYLQEVGIGMKSMNLDALENHVALLITISTVVKDHTVRQVRRRNHIFPQPWQRISPT